MMLQRLAVGAATAGRRCIERRSWVLQGDASASGGRESYERRPALPRAVVVKAASGVYPARAAIPRHWSYKGWEMEMQIPTSNAAGEGDGAANRGGGAAIGGGRRFHGWVAVPPAMSGRSCKGALPELQLCAGGASKLRRRSCKVRRGATIVRRGSCKAAPPELQWCINRAAKLCRQSCKRRPKLQWCATGAAMVRLRSCKAAPPELRPANVAVVGATSMLQASVKLRGGVASKPTSAPLPCCQPSGCHQWCCNVPMLHRRPEVLPTGVDASPVRGRGLCVGG